MAPLSNFKEISYQAASEYLAAGETVYNAATSISPMTKWKKVNGEVCKAATDGNENWLYAQPTPEEINQRWFMENTKTVIHSSSYVADELPALPRLSRGKVQFHEALTYMKLGWTFESEEEKPRLVKWFPEEPDCIQYSRAFGTPIWFATLITDKWRATTFRLRFDIKRSYMGPIDDDLLLAADATQVTEAVNHPKHYHPGPYEAIKVIRAWGLDSNFNLGNVVKYISRCNKKHQSPLEDLKKALWYLQDEINHMENNHAAP